MIKLNVELLKITEEIDQIKVDASIKTINQVDKVISYHNLASPNSSENIIINIFGLLQSLFVAIDALYSLTTTITHSKSYININQNKTLNHLKHIRNDIVGHPLNRYYGSDGIGYSVIESSDLKHNFFTYYTYIKKGNQINKTTNEINLSELKLAYSEQKEIIIERLNNYLINNRNKATLFTGLYRLYNMVTHENYSLVRDEFINSYGNLENHRFLWRLDLINYLLNKSLISVDVNNYLLKLQIIKLMEIANSLEQESYQIPFVKLPKEINNIYKYLNKNESLVNYLNNLHDPNSPYFSSDIEYLLRVVKNYQMLIFLNEIKNSEEKEKSYLLGQVFKNYRRK